MTVRWWLVAAFGPNEVAPRWPFAVLLSPAVLLAYLKLRRVL